MKKYILGFLAAGVLIVPAVSSAATVAELEAQINSLLQQITALQQQFSQSSGSTGSVEGDSGGSTSTVSSSGISCPNLKYNLYLGEQDSETDGDVTRLQQFLAQYPDIYPEGQITGYFGPLTEQAVKRWQAKHGLVSSGSPDTTGYGVVGPKTRMKIREMSCGETPLPLPQPQPTPQPVPQPPTVSVPAIISSIGPVFGTPYVGTPSTAVGDTVHVYGRYFEAGSYIAVDNTWTITPSLTSRTLLIFVVPPGMSLGTHSIQVGQKASDVALSNALPINIVEKNTQPSITITSPVGGSVLVKRNTELGWTWSSSGSIPAVDVFLVTPAGQSLSFAKTYPNNGSFWWAVGFASAEWNQDIPNGNYTIATCPSGVVIGSQCGKFNVTIYGDTPVIGIVYPVGGETFQVGGPITVSFSGVKGGEQYKIDLLKQEKMTPSYPLGTIVGIAGDLSKNTFTIPSNVPAGIYTVQVVQLTNQGSCVNACARAESKSFSITSTSTIAPLTATVRPNPTLNLTYDTNQSEASLEANFFVDVKAGSSDTVIYKEGRSWNIIATNQTRNGLTAGATSRTGFVSGDAVESTDSFIMPAGSSATFKVIATFNPKTMFSGSYVAHVQSLVYPDTNGFWNAVELSRVPTNSRVIVGEVSPYITDITQTTTTDGLIAVAGERFLPQGNIVDIDYGTSHARQFSLPSSDNGRLITSFVSNLGITPGRHSLSILSNATGRSNQVGFEVTSEVVDPIAPTITVLSPNGGDVWEAGENRQIKWVSNGNLSTITGIVLYSDKGNNWGLAPSNLGNFGSFDWDVIRWDSSTDKYKIRVASYSDTVGTVFDESEWFSIVAPISAAPTLTFSASAFSIATGQNSTLTWSSANTSSCSASGAWSGSKSVSGSLSVSPTQTSTYTLTCTGAGGSVVKSVTVSIVAPAPSAVFSNGRGSSFMVSLDKAEYRPGETIIANGSGGVVGVSGWYIFNYTMTAWVYNQEKTLNQVGVNGGNYSGQEIFTAPSQPGTYAAEFKTNVSYKKKDSGTISNDPNDSKNYLLTYTVVAPLTTTSSANINQMASALESVRFLLDQIVTAIKNLKR